MLICALLLIATYFDLRFREVPAWLTLTALLGSGVFAVFHGLWMPALLTVILCLVSEMTIPAQRRSFAAVLSGLRCHFRTCFRFVLPGALYHLVSMGSRQNGWSGHEADDRSHFGIWQPDGPAPHHPGWRTSRPGCLLSQTIIRPLRFLNIPGNAPLHRRSPHPEMKGGDLNCVS